MSTIMLTKIVSFRARIPLHKYEPGSNIISLCAPLRPKATIFRQIMLQIKFSDVARQNGGNL